MRGTACAYKVYKRGRYIGVYRASEIETLTGLPKARVNRYARARLRWQGVYRIVMAGEAKRAGI